MFALRRVAPHVLLRAEPFILSSLPRIESTFEKTAKVCGFFSTQQPSSPSSSPFKRHFESSKDKQFSPRDQRGSTDFDKRRDTTNTNTNNTKNDSWEDDRNAPIRQREERQQHQHQRSTDFQKNHTGRRFEERGNRTDGFQDKKDGNKRPSRSLINSSMTAEALRTYIDNFPGEKTYTGLVGKEYAICNAINHCDVDVLRILLDLGGSPNEKTLNGNTPILFAAQRGNIEATRTLIMKGADVNVANTFGWTPLFEAVVHDHLEIAQLLVEAGADVFVQREGRNLQLEASSPEMADFLNSLGVSPFVVDKSGWDAVSQAIKNNPIMADYFVDMLSVSNVDNRQSDQHFTFLHRAVASNNLHITQKLIEKGASFDLTEREGFTPLTLAIYLKHVEIAHFLIDQGADVDIVTKKKNSALSFAVCTNDFDLIQKILSQTKLSFDYKDTTLGMTILMKAVLAHNYHAVNLLIESGATQYPYNNQGNNALVLAATTKDHNIVQVMLQHGFDPNYASIDGWSPLTAACYNGSYEIVASLIEAGANINAFTKKQQSPLSEAAINGHLEIVKLLLAQPTINVNNPPHILCLLKDTPHALEIAQLLAARGAEVECSIRSITPISNSLHIRRKDLCDLFTSLLSSSLSSSSSSSRDNNNDDNSEPSNESTPALYNAIINQDLALIRTILSQDVNPETLVFGKAIPLEVVINVNNPHIVELFLECGFASQVNRPDIRGCFPIFMGLKNPTITRMLVVAGADINAIGPNGFTPLMECIYRGLNATAKYLLSQPSIRTDIIAPSGLSPFYLAVRRGNQGICELLLSRPDTNVNFTEPHGFTPLLESLRNHPADSPITRSLLDDPRTDVHYMVNGNLSPLSVATVAENVEAVEKLLERGVPVTTLSPRGETMLHQAVTQNSPQLVKLFVEKGIDVEVPDKKGETALILASRLGFFDLVRLLVEEFNANTEATNKLGWTPLMYATKYNFTPIVKFLMERKFSSSKTLSQNP